MTGDDQQTDMVLNCSPFGSVMHLGEMEKPWILEHFWLGVKWSVRKTVTLFRIHEDLISIFLTSLFSAIFVLHLRQLMSSPKMKIRKECCWLLSNICAGPLYQVQQIRDHGFFEQFTVMARDAELSVRKEAAFAVANASEKTEVVNDLVSPGGQQPSIFLGSKLAAKH